ncbi:MAG: efflux RND transporter periplasmic adaptor subunit [Cytophagales bacterium]|nr:efflux RND transporter periplasmic adaptor subunit [Rhizobacter sp.]
MSTHTKRITIALALLALGGAIGWGLAQWRGPAQPQPATAAPAARPVLYWYDPMVPTQKFDKPGKSPFMDMQLVPRYADEADAGSSSTPASITVSAQARQSLGIRLASVEKRTLASSIEAVGSVQLNERDVSIVQARTAGFVERVYARAPGDVVAAGAPLVDVLNPEWLAAQQEYLAVKATADSALAQAARQRLLLLGMPNSLIERAEQSGQPVRLQTITAPIGGVITELMVRGGMSVSPGMTLARINGIGTVWLEAALPEAQAAAIQPGQAVQARFAALPNEVIQGKVAAVLPEGNRDTRTLRLRIELPNRAQRLKAGMFAQVTLNGAPREALVVPAEAVIRTGKRTLVYLSEQAGRYRPVEVTVGEQFDEFITIRSGLTAGQQVVASGQFLIDSEASLQGVLARSTAPAASAATPASPAAATAPTAPTAVEYQTQGVVDEITATSITLTHQPVPELKWPAMTMPFKLADKTLAQGLKKGQAVQFSFAPQGDDYVMTRVAPLAGAPR